MSVVASSVSALARRCSRDTATLVEWTTCASKPQARSHRASQNPSRPASWARAMRPIAWPAFAASTRQRSTKRNSASGSGSSFFAGSRSTPGIIAATGQLAALISTTTTGVLFCPKAARATRVIDLVDGVHPLASSSDNGAKPSPPARSFFRPTPALTRIA